MGLAPQPGADPWWAIEARTRRDNLLVELGRRSYAGEPSERQRAQKIATRLQRYEASAPATAKRPS